MPTCNQDAVQLLTPEVLSAEVLDPIKESRPFEMPGGGGLSMALGSTPDGAGLAGSLKEKHSSALSLALGTSPSQQ